VTRSLITLLALAAPVLLVFFAATICGYGLAAGMGDAAAAHVFWWVGTAVLMLFGCDIMLLVLALAVAEMDRRQPPHDDGSHRES